MLCLSLSLSLSLSPPPFPNRPLVLSPLAPSPPSRFCSPNFQPCPLPFPFLLPPPLPLFPLPVGGKNSLVSSSSSKHSASLSLSLFPARRTGIRQLPQVLPAFCCILCVLLRVLVPYFAKRAIFFLFDKKNLLTKFAAFGEFPTCWLFPSSSSSSSLPGWRRRRWASRKLLLTKVLGQNWHWKDKHLWLAKQGGEEKEKEVILQHLGRKEGGREGGKIALLNSANNRMEREKRKQVSEYSWGGGKRKEESFFHVKRCLLATSKLSPILPFSQDKYISKKRVSEEKISL